jgi:hypothetical protein
MPQIQLNSPYLTGNECTWLKGNLHTHTTFSDGERPPEEVIADYERRGYDFLALSDHDTYVPPRDYQSLTRMALLPGVEVTAMGPHILQVGIEERLEPERDRQRVLDAITARGGLALFNHPNWEWTYNHFPQEMMQDLQGAIGLEVYNGVIERLEGMALATDRWDRLLSQGKWLWGFGNDDAHKASDVGIAWNVAQVPAGDRSPAAILDALRYGHFYASTGVTIDAIEVDGRNVCVRTRDAQRIRFVTRWGNIRATFEGAEANWQIPDDPILAKQWRYARAECYGAGGRMAWAQPIKIEIGD